MVKSLIYLPIIALPIMVSGCVNLMDDFTYSQKSDDFTGEKISEAVSTKAGDSDRTSKVSVTLRCTVSKDENDPYSGTTIAFKLINNSDKYLDESSIKIKMDDGAPFDFESNKDLNLSKGSGEFSTYYPYALISSLSDDAMRVNAMMVLKSPTGNGSWAGQLEMGFANMALAMAGKKQIKNYSAPVIHRAITDAAMNGKTMQVRYEGVGGAINTASFDISSASFKKVLSDCGWDELAKRNQANAVEHSNVAHTPQREEPMPVQSSAASGAIQPDNGRSDAVRKAAQDALREVNEQN